MIVKTEEDVLARCLDSIKDAVDEIIIVDTGSTDRTKEIALGYTDKVFDFEWINDFSAARNEAFSKATGDYQMWLDADDIFPEASLKKLLELKNNLSPDTDIVAMKYITNFDKNDNPMQIATRERLIKRDKGYRWIDPVHECIPLLGNVLYSDIEIYHRKIKNEGGLSFRNLNIYDELEKSGVQFTPRQKYYYARELLEHGQWIKSASYFEKFLDSGKGWVEDNIAACFKLSICYRILGQIERILPILTKSFSYDAPRAEICSEIGYYYKRMKNYRTALKWFKIAANLGEPDNIGFILPDYWGYVPNIECCICCCYLGDLELADEFNERAGFYKPGCTAVENNRKVISSQRLA